jgi:hypothetical protein
MNNFLITEVSRISQLMGVISEATINGPFIDLIIDITKLAEKKVGKISQSFDDAVKELKYVRTDEEAIRILARLTKESPEIAEKILPKVMQTISVEEKAVLNQLEEIVTDSLKKKELNQQQANEFIDGWVDETVKTEFSGVREIIKQDIKKNVRNSLDIVPVSKSNQQLVTKIKNVGSTWYTTLKSAGLSKAEIISVSKILPFRKLRADVQLFAENIFKNRIAGTENALEDMFGKLKTFTDQLQEGVVDLNYIRDINITLQSLKNNKNIDVDILRKEVVKSLKNAKGPNGETIPYDVVNKIDVYLSENIPTDIKSPSWVTEYLPGTSAGAFIKELTGAEFKFQSKFWNMAERASSYLTTGTFRKFEEFRSFYIKNGVFEMKNGIIPSGGLVNMYVMVSLVTKLFIPALFGIMISLVQAIEANGPKGKGMEYSERLYNLFMEKMWNAWLPKDPDGTLNWVKTLIPFNFFWDNIYNSWNSVSKGDYKSIWDAITRRTNEIEEQVRQRVVPVVPVVDDVNDAAKLELFYQFLKSKDNSLGSNDKPFMKKDPNTTNTFTFEACANEDCTQTKLETYTYNPTTKKFVEKIN